MARVLVKGVFYDTDDIIGFDTVNGMPLYNAPELLHQLLPSAGVLERFKAGDLFVGMEPWSSNVVVRERSEVLPAFLEALEETATSPEDERPL